MYLEYRLQDFLLEIYRNIHVYAIKHVFIEKFQRLVSLHLTLTLKTIITQILYRLSNLSLFSVPASIISFHRCLLYIFD